MIGALKFFNGSHDHAPIKDVFRQYTVNCTFNRYIKFGVFTITNYEDA